MADIQEQTQLANEVSEAISTSTYTGIEINDVRLNDRHPSVRGDADLIYITGRAEGRIGGTRARRAERATRRGGARTYTSSSGRSSDRHQYVSLIIICDTLVPLLSRSPEAKVLEEADEEEQLKELQRALAM